MKNGCHNREPFVNSYLSQAGYMEMPDGKTYSTNGHGEVTRVPLYEHTPNRMSLDCRYSILTPNDPACTGCKRHASVTGGRNE